MYITNRIMKKKRSEPDQQEQVPKKITTPVKLGHSDEKPTPTTPTTDSNLTTKFTFTLGSSEPTVNKESPSIPSNKRRSSTNLSHSPKSNYETTTTTTTVEKESNGLSVVQLNNGSREPYAINYWQDSISTEIIPANTKPTTSPFTFQDVTTKMKTTITQAKSNKARGLEPLKRELEKIIEESIQAHTTEIVVLKQEIEGRKSHTSFLKALVNNPTFSDLQIKIGDNVVHAHKAILASFIEDFDTYLTQDDNSESRDVTSTMDSMELEGFYDKQPIDQDIVQLFLEFVYTGSVQVPSQKVPSLLALANHLGISKLRDICCGILIKAVDEHNCLDLLEWASLHYQDSTSWQDLRQATLTYIASNCEKILTSTKANPSAISQLNIVSVKDIILSRDLDLEIKFEFFMRWALPKYNVYSIFDLLTLSTKQHKSTDSEEANCWAAVHLICMNYLASKFENMCNHSQFTNLSTHELKELLANDALSVKHEDIVVRSVLRWASSNKTAPLDEVIALIRWPYVSTSTLWACACSPLLVGTKGLSERLTEAILYQSAPLDKKTSITTSSKRDSYKTQQDVPPQDFARELLVMFQSIGKKEGVETLSQLATTRDYFVFVPSENSGSSSPAKAKEPLTEPKKSSEENEFSFGTTYLLNKASTDSPTESTASPKKDPKQNL